VELATPRTNLSRRALLRLVGTGAGLALLAACQPRTPVPYVSAAAAYTRR
jgi:hypothetical protein